MAQRSFSNSARKFGTHRTHEATWGTPEGNGAVSNPVVVQLATLDPLILPELINSEPQWFDYTPLSHRQYLIPWTSTERVPIFKKDYCLVDNRIFIMKWLTNRDVNIESFNGQNSAENLDTDKVRQIKSKCCGRYEEARMTSCIGLMFQNLVFKFDRLTQAFSG